VRQRFSLLLVAVLLGTGVTAGAQTTGPAPGQAPNSEAARLLADFQNFGPHRAFVVSPDGRASWWAGAGGADPGHAITSALKRCLERTKQECRLHIVNNYTVTGHDWRELVPARSVGAVDIGRLRPQPYWSMRGPQLATGLLVWSHGYMAGRNSTDSAPQPWVGHFTRAGYDLYRFDREWIADWASDATALADAVARAKAMGYRRVILAGQSAGAWVSLAALQRGAAADGVISIAAAHHGVVEKMGDLTRARSEWQHVLAGDPAGRARGRGQLRRRCLRRRRPHGRRAAHLREVGRQRRDRRCPGGLLRPRRRRRFRLRPPVRPLPAGLHRAGRAAEAVRGGPMIATSDHGM